MNILAYSGFVNSLLVLFVGVFIYYRSKRELIDKLFFLFCLAIFVWQGNYGFWQMADSAEESLFFLRFITIGSVLSSVFFFHLVLSILELEDKKEKLLKGIYLISFLILLSVFSPFYISEVRAYPFYSYWPIAGVATHLNILWGLILAIIAFVLLLRSHRNLKGERKYQVGYFIIALFILCIGGLFNTPQWYGISLFPYGNFLIFLYPLIVAFAVIKYHLFEIKVILTESLVLLMGLTLLVLPFVMPTTFLRILTASVFFLFCIFGYLLIRTTHHEIKRREDMERLTKELQKASRDIESLSNMKSNFLKVVNHQLRTPVSIIKGMASMLDEGSVKGRKKQEFIKKLYLSSERLATILDDILVAQGLIGGGESIKFSSCRIEEIVEERVERAKPLAKNKRLKLVFKKPKQPLSVTLADSVIIARTVSRLIDNAILYTEKGQIKVSVSQIQKKNKDFIQISVKDSGVGLNREDKKNLFRIFHRGKKAISLHPNGSGLGLFIVKNLIKIHKGTVEAESKGRGKGTTFIITLPVVGEV